MSISEIEELQAIVNDESRLAEERAAAAKHILQLQREPEPPQAAKTADDWLKEAFDAILDPVKRQQRLDRYIQTHHKCRVCLRHHPKQTTKCELCGNDGGEWLPVITDVPHCQPPYTKESLSNQRTYASPFNPEHLRWLLEFRHGDGKRQINADLFVPTSYVLSDDMREWVRQLLRWIEPSSTNGPATGGVCIYQDRDTGAGNARQPKGH